MLRIMIERNDTQKSVNSVVNDILNDQSPVSLKDTNFSFAFDGFMIDDDTFDLNNNSYFRLELIQWVRNPGAPTLTAENIPFSRCGNQFFEYYNQTEVEKLGIRNYFCPKSRNYQIQGNSLSNDFIYLEFNINKFPSQNFTFLIFLLNFGIFVKI